jgi:hypothetical protein
MVSTRARAQGRRVPLSRQRERDNSMKIYRRPPSVATGLIAIPRATADVAAIVNDLHTLGIPAHAVNVVGNVDEDARQALFAHGDPAPREARHALGATTLLLEPSTRFEVFGTAVGTLAGVLGGFIALALPGSGLLWFAGGLELLLAEEAAGGLLGAGLGAILGIMLGQRVIDEHEALFAKELAAGRVLVIARAEPHLIELAEARLRDYTLEHLDLI